MEHYDLVVIGAGPSGFAAAMRAVDFKKKTLIIEKNRVGGAGVEKLDRRFVLQRFAHVLSFFFLLEICAPLRSATKARFTPHQSVFTM